MNASQSSSPNGQPSTIFTLQPAGRRDPEITRALVEIQKAVLSMAPALLHVRAFSYLVR